MKYNPPDASPEAVSSTAANNGPAPAGRWWS